MSRAPLRSSRSLILLFGIPLLAIGCARYDFNLVKPEQFAATVERKEDTVVTRDPLEYHFRNVDNFLVVRIKNPTGDPIRLLGDRSSAVDGHGEAHPLRSQTIPPGAFVKVIVPPPRPTAYDPGPHFGFGFAYNYGGGLYDPWYYDGPRTYTLYDEGNNYYWDWRKNSSVKLTLTFERGEKTFADEFTFFKKKL